MGKTLMACALAVPLAMAGPARAGSDIRLSAIEPAGTSLAVRVEYPQSFTNRLDIFACSDLASGAWTLLATTLALAGTNSLTWLDPTAPQTSRRLDIVGTAGLDSDSDGIADAREILVYHTLPGVADSDSDGIPDGAEIERGTDPNDPGSGAAILYADSELGNDSHDGRSGVPGGGHGPKRSLGAAHQVAYSGDTILLSGAQAFSEPLLWMGGKCVVVKPVGAVVVRP